MGVILYPLYAFLYLVLLGYSVWVFRRTRTWSTLFLILIISGLLYDNLILSAGGLLGAGPLLETLSWPRFILHQFVLPLLIPVAAVQAGRAGLTWARHPTARIISVAATLLTITLGVLTRLVGQELQAESIDGVLRYSAVHVSGPPLVSILSIGFACVVGWFLWRRSGWPWLFWVGLAVFIGEGLPVKGLRLMIGSGIELIFMWIALQTELWSLRQKGDNE